MKYLEMQLIVEWKKWVCLWIMTLTNCDQLMKGMTRGLTACRALTGSQRSCGNSEWEMISIFRMAELKIWYGSLQIAGQQMPANTTVISNYLSSISTYVVSVQTSLCQEGSLNIRETAWCGLGHSWSAFLPPLLLVRSRKLLCPGDFVIQRALIIL